MAHEKQGVTGRRALDQGLDRCFNRIFRRFRSIADIGDKSVACFGIDAGEGGVHAFRPDYRGTFGVRDEQKTRRPYPLFSEFILELPDAVFLEPLLMLVELVDVGPQAHEQPSLSGKVQVRSVQPLLFAPGVPLDETGCGEAFFREGSHGGAHGPVFDVAEEVGVVVFLQIAAHEFDLAAGVDCHEADPLGQGEILHDLKALRWIMHQRGDEFRQPAEVMLERDGLIRFAAEQDLVAIHHVECRKGNGVHTAPALLLQHGSFHAIHGEQAYSDSEQDQRPGDEQYQFVLCGQDHRSSQGWLPRARARLAGSPRSGVLCLTSFSSGRNTRCAPGKETPLIFRSTPMHGKGRIQKHGLRNTLESIVPAHKCQTVMIPCPAFWNPVSVFSVLLFFLFPFAAGWLGKTGLRKSGDSRLSGTFRPYR